MPEYIERKAAYPLAKKICDAIDSKEFQQLNFGMRILDWIDDIPAADVRPVVRGKWEEDWETGCSKCSACGESYLWEDYDGVGEWNFCPNCGAALEKS